MTAVVNSRDVSERNLAEAQLSCEHLHDPLTGLVLAAGASEYLTKSIDLEEILARLDTVTAAKDST